MNRLPPTRIVVLLMAAVLLAGGGITMWSRNASLDARARYEKLLTEVPDEAKLQKKVSDSQVVVDGYKTQLQHLATAAAINFSRLAKWFRNPKLAQTRTSSFAELAPAFAT